MKEYFETLNLKEGASQEEIQAAYDKLSKELNPTNNDNQEFFKEEYDKVQEAYEALYNSSILASNNVKIENTDKIPESSNNEDHIQKPNKNLFKYIWKRKKNTSLLIMIIPLLKVILHYSFYPITSRQATGTFLISRRKSVAYSNPYRESVGEHIDVLFEAELNLFVVATGIVLFVAWFFNDKIKAR